MKLQLAPNSTLLNSPHNTVIYLHPKLSKRRYIEVTRNTDLELASVLKAYLREVVWPYSIDH